MDDHDLSLKSEVLDLAGVSVADLCSGNDEVLTSLGNHLLRNLYLASSNYAVEPPT